MPSSVFEFSFSKGSLRAFFRFQLGNLKRLITRSKFQESINPSAAVTIFAQAFDSNHFIVKFLREYIVIPLLVCLLWTMVVYQFLLTTSEREYLGNRLDDFKKHISRA